MNGDLLRKLTALGLTMDQVAGVVDIMDEQAEDRRSKGRDRWRKWKDRQTANVSKHEQTLAAHSCGGDARGVDNLLTTEISGQKENKKDAAPKALSDLAAFKTDLEQDATPEQVDAFVKHRKTKKGQNSAYSAKLFRKDAAACGLSVSQAIDTAISRGWLTVKPEYLAARQPQQRAASPPPETVGSFSRKQLFEQRQSDATDDSAGRVVQIDARRLEGSPSGTRTFAVSGNLLGRI